jgi:hypothetical protein
MSPSMPEDAIGGDITAVGLAAQSGRSASASACG